VHDNDVQITRNALFTWAPWPVAMAFGARATARSRGLVLNVRQRPSYTAGVDRHELRLTDVAHDFLRGRELLPLSHLAPRHAVASLTGTLSVTVEPLVGSNATLPVRPSGRGRSSVGLGVHIASGRTSGRGGCIPRSAGRATWSCPISGSEPNPSRRRGCRAASAGCRHLAGPARGR
jgi:hypothetical protein